MKRFFLTNFVVLVFLGATALEVSAYEANQCKQIGAYFSVGQYTLIADYGSATAGTDVYSSTGIIRQCDGVDYLETDWGLIPGYMLRFSDPKG